MPKLRKPKSAAQGNGHICVYAVIAVVAVLVAAYAMSSEPRQKPPHRPKLPNRNRKESAKIFAQAFELYTKQDMSAAAERFEDYLRLEPKDVSALNNKGLVHTELSDFDAAIKGADIILASVSTPIKQSGVGAGYAPDLQHWEKVARRIASVAEAPPRRL